MMQTVLRNLVTNAVKFTPRGGRISVGVRSEKEQTIYTVRDNGIGIPEERRIKLFTLGETRSTKGTESEKGTDSVWSSARNSSTSTAEKSPWKAASEKERSSQSQYRPQKHRADITRRILRKNRHQA